jgi:hypothetical protein
MCLACPPLKPSKKTLNDIFTCRTSSNRFPSFNGDLRFGSNRAYMNERTAMHEISHTLGIGQTNAFNTKCASGDWRTALPLLRSWDGAGAVINCGGSHIWPYGLNYDTEWSETNANRHVQLINAMIRDGMQG